VKPVETAIVMSAASGKPNVMIPRELADILSDVGDHCGSITTDRASYVLICWWKLQATNLPYIISPKRVILAYSGLCF
jgi:hypothetical protein